MNKPTNIVVHHSLTPKILLADAAERSFNNSHKARFFPRSVSGWYIGYHYVIYGNGEVRQYRQHNEVGAHTSQQSMNYKSIGICLSGNFDVEDPNPAQVEALRILMSKLVAEFKIKHTNIYPHRHFAPKSCYGNRLSDTWARDLLKPVNVVAVEFLEADGSVTLGLAFRGLKVGSINWAGSWAEWLEMCSNAGLDPSVTRIKLN